MMGKQAVSSLTENGLNDTLRHEYHLRHGNISNRGGLVGGNHTTGTAETASDSSTVDYYVSTSGNEYPGELQAISFIEGQTITDDDFKLPTKDSWSNIRKHVMDDHSQYSVNPRDMASLSAVSYAQMTNRLSVNDSTFGMPLPSQLYPHAITIDTPSGTRSVLPKLNPLKILSKEGSQRIIGAASHNIDYNFDNLRHINTFFMADEARLPVYIAAFSSGFFSVLICLCAILYTRYIFMRVRKMKSDKRKRLDDGSSVPLLDEKDIEQRYKNQSLAEIRAMNPSLARIEDYIRGEVKKWEERARLAEESAAPADEFQNLMRDLTMDSQKGKPSDSNAALDAIFKPSYPLDEMPDSESDSEDNGSEEEDDEYDDDSSDDEDSEYSSDSDDENVALLR
ncbi:putative integral membrane protein [Babesia bovis T2Bo]|uniref:Uncharacterized protein n=1 Tax=Babesia bovis TaxID=5865 RepID=A7APF6_BABBO|nr:putative integral membrane protein [Babesia bovis T2Bo]EDO08440.1 putative integral membrane protein [Babesia bovis T2Bo]|eukprot:XP_001612008.1 hypothetical protein [Babesia bovis T2Bo]